MVKLIPDIYPEFVSYLKRTDDSLLSITIPTTETTFGWTTAEEGNKKNLHH